jgi:catalase
MSSTQPLPSQTSAEEVLQLFHDINGPHPGYRPAHAKGILIAGRFTPSAAAPSLTSAPHTHRASTAVTVRFSDSTGIPNIGDNDPNAGPRGMATRFHLAEHIHTDIIAHSVDAFPARTLEEFAEMLRAVRASGPGVPSPTPIEAYLATHPAALRFVQAPKPVPASFFKESFYSVSAHRFLAGDGSAKYGRYRIRPTGSSVYLDPSAAANQPPDFLFDDVRKTLAQGALTMRIAVQIAAESDVVDDATAHWPDDRQEIDFGTLELSSVLPNQESDQQKIIFDPIPRVAGIEPSADPLLDPRAAIYLASGRRRRAEHQG